MISFLAPPVILLAPMAGVTDFPFRQVVRKMGAPSLVISEMVASQAMIRKIRKTVQRNCQAEERTGVQLLGNDPETMAEAARMSVDRGACLIDINMGCPMKKIAIRSDAGAALMRDEILVGKIFRAIVKAVTVPVTVKMRKGWDEQHQNALSLARIAQNEGLAYATIHGRTRAQLFTGKADWAFIGQIQQSISFPIIGNGDIIIAENAKEVLQQTSGIMVGRGCCGRPWFLDQIRHFLKTGQKKDPPPLTQQGAIIQEHLNHILHYYGRESGLPLAKKHLSWYSKGLSGASDFRAQLFAATDPTILIALVKTFFQQ